MYFEFKIRMSILTLLFIVLSVYYPTLFAPLNSVDDSAMQQFLLNTDTFTLRSIFLPGGSASYYRPIVAISFIIDKIVWGLEASFMHLENILVHLANSLLVFAITRRAAISLNKPSSLVAFTAALFFAIHPINTEAVNWISGRTDLLAGFFLLLSMLMLLRQQLTWHWSFVAALCMLLACCAKETAIFFLPAAFLFPYFISGTKTNVSSLRYVVSMYMPHLCVFSAAGSAYFAFRSLAFSQGDQGVVRVMSHVVGAESVGLLENVRISLKIIGFYAKKLLIPFPLNFGITYISEYYKVVGIIVSVYIFWLLTRKTLPAFFVLCAGLVGLSALMIPLLRVTWTPVAERYMYIPSAFFIVGFALALLQWERRFCYRNYLVVVFTSLTFVFFYGTAKRNILWQDNLALFQDTLQKSPDFTPAKNEIANALYAKGKLKEASVIYKSFSSSGEIINFQYGLANKAFALAQEGNYDSARQILQQALLNPGKHELMLLNRLLEVDKIAIMKGKAKPHDLYASSVQTLTRLCELTGDPFYSYRLGIVHMQVGERQKAIEAFNIVVRTSSPTAYYRKPAEKLAKELAM